MFLSFPGWTHSTCLHTSAPTASEPKEKNAEAANLEAWEQGWPQTRAHASSQACYFQSLRQHLGSVRAVLV